MREGRAHGQRADQDPERGAAALAIPGRHHLQRGGIYLRQGRSGQEAERQGSGGTVGEDDQGVGEGRAGRSGEDHALRPEDVREVQQGRAEGAGHEPELDGDRQPGGAAGAEPPIGAELRDHSRG